jgi:hypothetical protein
MAAALVTIALTKDMNANEMLILASFLSLVSTCISMEVTLIDIMSDELL